MTQHMAVNPQDHKQVRILQERSDAMGDDMMCCVTFPEEFRQLQAHYPILFQLNQSRDEFVCLALFGFENGENLFLKEGRWDARYVPLAMDIQPFTIGLPQKEGDDRKVVIDMGSPKIAEGEGQRLFDDNGMATDYLENISRKLALLDEGFKKSKNYIQALQAYDLLEPLNIDVTLNDGSKNRLVGFHTIHEERLAALDEKALKELQAQGYLLPTYMMLASLSNLSELIARRNVRLRALRTQDVFGTDV